MAVPNEKASVTPAPADTGPDDDEILDLVAAGRHHAFDLLVTRHGGRVRRYLRQTLGNDPALDDLTQDVFVRVFRGAQGRRRRGTFRVWLYRVARNIAVDHIRHTQVDRRVRAGVEEQLLAAEAATESPLDRVELLEFESEFRTALEEVPEEFRTPFLLREQEQMSYEQIAEVLDSSVKTISTRIYRARNRLRGLLASHLPSMMRSQTP